MIKHVLLVCGFLRIASGDFDCLCSWTSHQTIYSSPSTNAEVLGSIYKTCKAISGNVTGPWVPILHVHQVNLKFEFKINNFGWGSLRANLCAIVYLLLCGFCWRGFLFLWVLGMGYVILLWHSLSLPYNYFDIRFMPTARYRLT